MVKFTPYPVGLPEGDEYGPATVEAVALSKLGVRVLPCHQVTKTGCSCSKPDCRTPGKHPRVPHGVDEATTDLRKITKWASLWPDANWGQALDDRVVIDIDVANDKPGDATWAAVLAKRGVDADDPTLATLRYRTGRGGVQMVFMVPAGVKAASIPDKLGDAVDLKRGAGHYVMVPGSVTDSAYEVTRDAPALILPPWVIDVAKKHRSKEKAAVTRAAKVAGVAAYGLAGELAKPPGTEGNRNTWLTSVGGYLVKGVTHEDGLFSLLRTVSHGAMGTPLGDDEVLVVARSLLRSDEKNHPGGGPSDPISSEECGYLQMAGDGSALQVLTSDGDLEMTSTYLNCGVRCTLILDEGETRYYRIVVTGKNHTGDKTLTVKAWRLTEGRERKRIFGDLGYSFNPPAKPVYPISDDARLINYLESQNPPRGQAVQCLGWHDGVFLTSDGTFRESEGWGGYLDKVPSIEATGASRSVYGHRIGHEEAREVLREVYTFQEPMVAAVSMAWWAMCLLKGTYRSSIAPILHLDAPSESGKTNGFFAFLVALAGNTTGSGTITTPRIRAQLASNSSGIVWVDDVSNLRGLGDVLRQAASKGAHVKTDTGDNMTTIEQKMVGNVLLSCEGLGDMLNEKAMRDRIISLKVPPVKGRRSTRGDYPQWDDILALLAKYGTSSDGYAVFAHRMAGTMVELLAAAADDEELDRRGGSGRHDEKHAILRTGARIIATVLGTRDPVAQVEKWIAGSGVDLGGQNMFIGSILPRILREYGYPSDWKGSRYGRDDVVMPCYVDKGSVLVSPEHCADAWSRIHGLDDRQRQLGTTDAIRSELQACGMTFRGSAIQRRSSAGGFRVSYWRLPKDLSRVLLVGSGDVQGTL